MQSNSGDQVEYVWIKEQHRHAIERPDMYLGPTDHRPICGMTIRATNDQPEGDNQRAKLAVFPFQITMNPGLLKIFDELVVNALDNAFRDSTQRNIRVAIDPVSGRIFVLNDGKGISDTRIDDRYAIDVIFGQFMSGSNLTTESSFTGGRNGVGAAIANAFSKEFTVRSACPESKTTYTQTWSNNMEATTDPKIKKCGTKNGFVSVTFLPDYERFNTPIPSIEQPMDQGIVDALCSRVMEVAVCSSSLKRKMTVHLFVGNMDPNLPTKIPWTPVSVKSPGELLAQILKDNKRTIATDRIDDDNTGLTLLDVAVTCVSAEEAATLEAHDTRVLAYVNGVRCCCGTHVNHIERQLVEMVRSKVLAKMKKSEQLTVKRQQVLSRLAIVATCLVADKKFTSQTKECLSTANLGFAWSISKKFENALCDRTSLVGDVLASATAKQTASNQKSASGRSKPVRIDKYDAPACRKGSKTKPTLLIVEGDSAKSFAVAGLSQIGRENHGIMPLRGKLINVRSNSELRNSSNKEITDLCKILNLQPGKQYSPDDVDKLPFGSITVLTDQDSDGVHILGLILNWLHYSFPSLLKANPNFCKRFFTPLVKVILADKTERKFFSLKAFHDWQSTQSRDVMQKSVMQFYKGLGTSTSAEARECFKDEKHHTMTLRYTGDPCDESMSLYFDAKRAGDRKMLIGNQYDENNQLDFTQQMVSFNDIVHKDLVHFARYDTERSLPSLIDGLKIVLRKVAYFSLNKLRARTKVAQLGAAAACFSQYHHGETSICEAVVGLAQEHVGTNNVALLLPEGQFGSRSNKPSVHAAVRYLHSQIQPITTKLFRPEDTPLLTNLVDEGKTVEPEFYVPVVPYLLLNGSAGIGTGYSTFIPPCNPSEVINASRLLAQGQPVPPLTPWFDGFKGTVALTGSVGAPERFTTTGVFTLDDATSTLTITDLPIHTWTDTYLDTVKRVFMEGSDPIVKDVFNGSTEHSVLIELKVADRVIGMTPEQIVKEFKLESSFTLTNMCGFDHTKKLVHVDKLSDIVRMHGDLRLALYRKRLDYQIDLKTNQIALNNELLRFVEMVVADQIKVFRRSHQDIVTDLRAASFAPHPPGRETDSKEFEHLLSIAISQFTQDKIDQLTTKIANLQQELNVLMKTTPSDLWLRELDELKDEYDAYLAAKAERQGNCAVTRKRKTNGTKRSAERKKQKKVK